MTKLATAKILLVDDDRVNQMIGSRLLEELGVRVELASDGSEAMLKLSQSRFDLIFMDLEMPTLSGFETVKKLRNELKCATPVVALTANTNQDTEEKCRAAHFNGYLSKPYDRDAIGKTLERFLHPNQLLQKTV